MVQAALSNEQILNNIKLSTFTYSWCVFHQHDRVQVESPTIQTSNNDFNLVWEMFYYFQHIPAGNHDCKEVVGFKLKNCEPYQ